MISRQSNFLGQMRVDAPHLRAMESSVVADFDVLAGQMMAGKAALVLKGFGPITTGAVGAPASSLQVNVADSLAMHFNASENGTLFWVPSDRAVEQMSASNPRVSGSFTASQTNYVGIDISRSADDSTSDSAQFWEPTSKLEVSKTVPLARTLDYQFVISTSDFSSRPNILPIAKVVTDASNNVSSIQDARWMMFRLGSGGDFPNVQHAFSWPGTRRENTTGDVFAGGDKAIGSLKGWMDAVMSRLWEIGGGEFWYSATADRNVTMVWSGSTFTNGENFEWVSNNLHWKGLKFLFDNSTGYYNDVKDQTADSAGLTNLADGECLYVDVDRTQNLTGGAALVPVKGLLTTIGASTVPGARQIFAWRIGSSVYTRNWRYAVGTTFTPATTTSLGMVKLNQTPGAGGPYVVSIMSNGQIEVTSTSGHAIKGTSGGTAPGVWGVGNATDGIGIKGEGGGSGDGVQGTSALWGVHGITTGSLATNFGVFGEGGGGLGVGVRGVGGSGGGAGGSFVGGGAAGVGVKAQGSGTGAAVDCTNGKIVNVADPASAQDAVTKNYIDTATFSILNWQSQDIPLSGVTGYARPWGGSGTYLAAGTFLEGVFVPFAGVVRNLCAMESAGSGAGTDTLTITLMKNGVATALVITTTNAALCSAGKLFDNTHSVTVAQGDVLSIRITTGAGGTTTTGTAYKFSVRMTSA